MECNNHYNTMRRWGVSLSRDSGKGHQLTDLEIDSISPLHKFPGTISGKKEGQTARWILSDSNRLPYSYLFGVIITHSDTQGGREEGPKKRNKNECESVGTSVQGTYIAQSHRDFLGSNRRHSLPINFRCVSHS